MTPIAYILIFGVLGGLTASAIYGMWWAVRRGQFSNFAQGATSIFDDEEPMGFRTDAFPDEGTKGTTHGPATPNR